jgi:hypothetical protein
MSMICIKQKNRMGRSHSDKLCHNAPLMKDFLEIINCWKVFKQYMNIEEKKIKFLAK